MKESYVCSSLYRIFDYEIPLEEIRSLKDRRKGKKLNMFISKLKEYCEENNLL